MNYIELSNTIWATRKDNIFTVYRHYEKGGVTPLCVYEVNRARCVASLGYANEKEIAVVEDYLKELAQG